MIIIVIVLAVFPFINIGKDSFIEINSDEELEAYSSYGNGTVENPFLIQDLIITDEMTKAISITNTSKYFIIQNCYLADNHGYGIYLDEIANGTVKIFNNVIINHDIAGISIRNSDFVEITNNSIIQNNNGIELIESNYNLISFNGFTENTYGINFVSQSSLNDVNLNRFENSTSWGMILLDFSNNNTIHHNDFLKNNLGGISQAFDNSTYNIWYEFLTSEGNYWDNLVNSTYSIAGSANSIDLYPLVSPIGV